MGTNVTDIWALPGGTGIGIRKSDGSEVEFTANAIALVLQAIGSSLTLSDVTDVTATAAEVNKNAGVTAGTVAASKVVVVDANKDASGFRHVTATGTVQAATAKVTTSLVFETGANDVTLTATGANVIATNLPTTDPQVAGALWIDTQTLKVSAGS